MFFGAIYQSNIYYFGLLSGELNIADVLDFSSLQNYQTLIIQAFYLILAYFYLWFRGFDFGVLFSQIKFNSKAILWAFAIFIITAFAMDLYDILAFWCLDILGFKIFDDPAATEFSLNITFSLVIYALFNGFFEEIFFLGICLALDKKYLKFALFFSLFVRFSFHTYQGMLSAIGIGFLFGGILYFLYQKIQNLLPFFLGHTLADIFGLSLYYVFYSFS